MQLPRHLLPGRLPRPGDRLVKPSLFIHIVGVQREFEAGTQFDLPGARVQQTMDWLVLGRHFLAGFEAQDDTNADSAIKLIYMAIHEASKRWTLPIKNWKGALNHFAILFEHRLPSSARN